LVPEDNAQVVVRFSVIRLELKRTLETVLRINQVSLVMRGKAKVVVYLR
jgi:hypothetical protein